MSHFTVLVVSNPDQNPEDLLTPFQEQDLEDFDKNMLEFSVEYDADKCDEEARRIVDDTKDDDKTKEKLIKMLADGKYKDIVKEWGNYEEDDEGNLGNWYNPEARWDWYQLGGRWAGMLKVKKGKEGTVGDRSWANEKEKLAHLHCDSALVSDIDFNGMANDKIRQSKKWYAQTIKLVEENVTKNNFSRDKAIEEASWRTGISLKEFDSEQKYLDSVRAEGFHTYAFITPNGKWHGEGEMGWFGCSTDEHPNKYKRIWNKMIKNLKPDQTLSIYDCHI